MAVNIRIKQIFHSRLLLISYTLCECLCVNAIWNVDVVYHKSMHNVPFKKKSI